ncbi:MAG TPA: peptidoglycan-binding protein [Trebonia sp.]|nr:peptidoglycan-binding protein [Trebonia sp.]
MLNRKPRQRSTVTSATHRGRGLRHITARHVGMIVVALATALTGVAIIAPRASAATACVYRTFEKSNTYQQCVRDEQVLLNDLYYHHVLGPDRILTVDGYYGSNTFDDVWSFQKETFGYLTVDGITGPHTWQYLCQSDWASGFTGAFYQDAGCAAVVVIIP